MRSAGPRRHKSYIAVVCMFHAALAKIGVLEPGECAVGDGFDVARTTGNVGRAHVSGVGQVGSIGRSFAILAVGVDSAIRDPLLSPRSQYQNKKCGQFIRSAVEFVARALGKPEPDDPRSFSSMESVSVSACAKIPSRLTRFRGG